MTVMKHYAFRLDTSPLLCSYLSYYNIKHKIVDSIGFGVLDMDEADPHWGNIYELIRTEGRPLLVLSNTVFTKQELLEAQWLSVRSVWRFGCPQPMDSYQEITYSCENYCKECGTGARQIDSFRMAKAPKWGRRHFLMLNWVEDELFCDDEAKEKLSTSGLTGFTFMDVKNKRGTALLPGVYQLVIERQLQAGLVTPRRSIDNITPCPCCGRIIYHPTGIERLAFNKNIFHSAPDIMKCNEHFGWGHYAAPDILISQAMYQLLTSQKLDKNLVFQALELV